MSDPCLAAIYRYPIKGFGGENLDAVQLSAGRGIVYDRSLAIANGERDVATGDKWTPCQAFMRLTKNTDLTRYAVSIDENALTAMMTAPNGNTATLSLSGAATLPDAQRKLTEWFSGSVQHLPVDPVRVRSSMGQSGYWDHEDAALSLINLETLALLERFSGQAIDPLRFRGNFYVSGLPPLDELNVLGRQMQIGDVLVEVIRPIDRCRATSVDPHTGDTSFNMPALLSRALGHIFCGVYVRVVRGGSVSQGAAVTVVADAPKAARDGSRASTAPPVSDWPRTARLVERVIESDSVVSFWFNDPLAELRSPPKAGQHVRVHLIDHQGEPQWRAYTISGVAGSKIRISVKRDGHVSAHLHDHLLVNDPIMFSGPFGNICLEKYIDVNDLLLLISAGIGITPSIAILRELVASQNNIPVCVRHVARNANDLALWNEAKALAGQLHHADISLHLTQAHEAEVGAAGRPNFRSWMSNEVVQATSIYICGPGRFVSDVRDAFIEAGASLDQIHIEVFASPQKKVIAESVHLQNLSGPFRVKFRTCDQEAIWTSKSGTLLDLAEQCGMSPAVNCRSGVCGTCRVRLLSGNITHFPEPVIPVASDHALLCCAAPTSDVEIG